MGSMEPEPTTDTLRYTPTDIHTRSHKHTMVDGARAQKRVCSNRIPLYMVNVTRYRLICIGYKRTNVPGMLCCPLGETSTRGTTRGDAMWWCLRRRRQAKVDKRSKLRFVSSWNWIFIVWSFVIWDWRSPLGYSGCTICDTFLRILWASWWIFL